MTATPQEPVQQADHLVWLDLEMTGLDPQTDVILQAALIITDRELVPLDEYVCDIWQPESALAKMTPFVREMHAKTGLTERVRRSTLDVAQAEKALFARIAAWCPFGAGVLAGNSVGQDQRFIQRYMPLVAGYLNYRILDVTSVKLLCRLWYPEPRQFAKSEEGAHDALVDIKSSIAELAHYRASIFRAD
ncbi:MAG: oligoribonuclease [Polyangiaceae bacterium]|nr:oligoribonuclease [Polyangiaceae bacterium]MCW5789319.1 oligoribonuclease [Polyangiaceae bacterium]